VSFWGGGGEEGQKYFAHVRGSYRDCIWHVDCGLVVGDLAVDIRGVMEI